MQLGRIDEHGRECARCKEYKLWEFYGKDKARSTGYTPRCKKCIGDVTKNRRRVYRNLTA